MSEKKMFTASEVARMILEKTHNTLKKHEEIAGVTTKNPSSVTAAINVVVNG
jgi:hypothetical protein